MLKCKACGKEHKENLGISNSFGFFCSFIHALNFDRGRSPEARFYTCLDRFGAHGHGPEPMDAIKKKAQQLRILKQNKNRVW